MYVILLMVLPLFVSADDDWSVLKQYFDKQVPYKMDSYNPYFEHNEYVGAKQRYDSLPTFVQSVTLLPKPHWKGHDDVIKSYWRAWEIALGNIKNPTPANGYVSPYIDPAFNGNIFM